MTDEQAIRLSREKLYQEIWTISASGVANKYNIPYDELLKLCKQVEIPIPPSGYWTKLKFSKPVVQAPLLESMVTEVVLPVKNAIQGVSKKMKLEKKEIKNSDDYIVEENKALYRVVSGQHNVYNREKLYKEVWEKPVVKVAEQYGVSDVAIHKICKTLKIPTPPAGSWAKIRAGAVVKRIPLPQTKGPIQITGVKTFEGVKEQVDNRSKIPLEFLSDFEREKIFQATLKVKAPNEKVKIHKKILSYRSIVDMWNRKDTKAEGTQKGKSNYYSNPPFLAGVISNNSLSRVYQLLSTLFEQVEALGGLVNEDLSLQIRNERVDFSIAESQDQIDHIITKEEAQALIKYKDEKRHDSYWARKPKIRKYDYIFNGKLKISVYQGKYFKDTENEKVESRLGDILIALYEKSEKVRIDREAKEEEARRQEEEQKRKEERRQRYNEEVERTIALENEAVDYETACKIRSYVDAVKSLWNSKHEMDEQVEEWIQWAMKKADWLDPIVARDDDFFGKREHGESQEKKALKKTGYWW